MAHVRCKPEYVRVRYFRRKRNKCLLQLQTPTTRLMDDTPKMPLSNETRDHDPNDVAVVEVFKCQRKGRDARMKLMNENVLVVTDITMIRRSVRRVDHIWGLDVVIWGDTDLCIM